MKRSLVSFLLLGFILWILPLGYFVKPAQQKLFCDGQRGMCMCHVMMKVKHSNDMEPGINLKAGSASNKENSLGGGSNYFISPGATLFLNLRPAIILEKQFLSYNSPFLASLEHVPKI